MSESNPLFDDPDTQVPAEDILEGLGNLGIGSLDILNPNRFSPEHQEAILELLNIQSNNEIKFLNEVFQFDIRDLEKETNRLQEDVEKIYEAKAQYEERINQTNRQIRVLRGELIYNDSPLNPKGEGNTLRLMGNILKGLGK